MRKLKRILSALLIMVMSISCMACGEKQDFVGTWVIEYIKLDGKKFSIEEWKDFKDEDLSGFRIIIKDNGKAHVYNADYDGAVKWSRFDGGINIGEKECLVVDELICYRKNSVKIYFKKVSEQQKSLEELADQVFAMEEDFDVPPSPAKIEQEPFVVYISGSDTRNINDIPEEGLADANLVVAVDPTKNKILIVNTPREYYVALDGDSNKMDKLSHAGNYGIQCSMKTLENLYDIKFNYYVRVNFKSLVDIVDTLGGITVNSEYAFSSGHSLSKKTYNFKKGENELTGDAALAFVRERKAFAAGDRQRGKNQMLVLKAIVDKAISPSILIPSNLEEMLSCITANTKTNISSEEIKALFKMQLEKMSGWDIESISVDGTGSSKYTYTYNERPLYVMIPDEDTVREAQKALSAFS